MRNLENHQTGKSNKDSSSWTDSLLKAAEIASFAVPGAPAALKTIRELSKQQPNTADPFLTDLIITDDANGKVKDGNLEAPQTSPENRVQQESPTDTPNAPEGGGDGGSIGKSGDKPEQPVPVQEGAP